MINTNSLYELYSIKKIENLNNLNCINLIIFYSIKWTFLKWVFNNYQNKIEFLAIN